MHGRIVQLSFSPLDRSGFELSESDIAYMGADWIGDERDEDVGELFPDGMFKVDKAEQSLTYTGDDSKVRDWFEKWRKKVAELDYEDEHLCSKVRNLRLDLKDMDGGIYVFIDDWCGGVEGMLDFCLAMSKGVLPEKLYYGIVLDYHY